MLDCMMCDAMTPEFKAANAILLAIIRANDKSDAISHTMLAAVGKAFKENDAKKSRDALARINADLSKREKALNDELVEARTKLAETTKRNTDAKAAIAQIRKDMGLFDKFVASANAVKTSPKGLSKLSMFDLKLKKYGDFAKHIARINQLVSAKKDHAKATDTLVKAIEKAKEKAKKDTAKAERELKESAERVKAWKDMEKMRARNIELFRKQQDDLRKMAAAIPDESKVADRELDAALKEWDKANKTYEEIVRKEKEFLNQLNATAIDIGEQLRRSGSSDYEKQAKRAIWDAKEAIEKLRYTVPNVDEDGNKLMPREWRAKDRVISEKRAQAAEIMRKAYKLSTAGDADALRNEVSRAKAVLKDAGIAFGGVFDAVDALKTPQVGKVHGVDLSKLCPDDIYEQGMNIDYFLKRNMPDAMKQKNEMRQKRREAYKAREEIGKKVHSLGGKTPADVTVEMSEHDRQFFS